MKTQTIYKVLAEDLRSMATIFPSFDKSLAVQYSTQQWVTGEGASKLFCFVDLESARSFVQKNLEKHGVTTLQIWEASGFNVKPAKRRLLVDFHFSRSFVEKFWNRLMPWNHRRVKKCDPSIYWCDKMILVKRVDNLE
jgi:hypothetical protein